MHVLLLRRVVKQNVTATGRALANIAVTVKDILREMKELKPASSYPDDEYNNVSSPAESSADAESKHDDDDGYDDGTYSFSTSLHKQVNSKGSNDLVNSLEKLLKQSQGIGVQIDELGACLYPPQ
ncbi:hypothetical protein RJ641_003358 [Dillenia turbinata]|uniref:Cyclin-D1-binding protein 1-like C-terminal domain-containing protein n=1 Tax=Dillenia turbinata TaxID=194707 RepID=A0AAN8VCM8_9MAGN